VRIAVLGGSGMVGRHVVDDSVSRGHEAVSLSRSSGVDVTTGTGLDEALSGFDAVIDVTNVLTIRRTPAQHFFERSAKSVQAAAQRCGVPHVVVLSIVGIDRFRTLGYYDAKVTQERLHLDGPVPATVLRATQFHEFPLQIVARSTALGVATVPSMRVQTVAARSVAHQLVDAACGEPHRGRLPDVAGPGPSALLPVLARRALEKTGSRTRVLALRVPGAAGRATKDGAQLPADDATLVGPSFDEWLVGPDGPGSSTTR
jgi:uncharacterized protein YbjT (DUF2867 family)